MMQTVSIVLSENCNCLSFSKDLKSYFPKKSFQTLIIYKENIDYMIFQYDDDTESGIKFAQKWHDFHRKHGCQFETFSRKKYHVSNKIYQEFNKVLKQVPRMDVPSGEILDLFDKLAGA